MSPPRTCPLCSGDPATSAHGKPGLAHPRGVWGLHQTCCPGFGPNLLLKGWEVSSPWLRSCSLRLKEQNQVAFRVLQYTREPPGGLAKTHISQARPRRPLFAVGPPRDGESAVCNFPGDSAAGLLDRPVRSAALRRTLSPQQCL